jgi:hypothetical protein
MHPVTPNIFVLIDAYLETDEGRVVRSAMDIYDRASPVYQRAMDAMYKAIAAMYSAQVIVTRSHTTSEAE